MLNLPPPGKPTAVLHQALLPDSGILIMTSIQQVIATLTAQADEVVEWPPIRLRVRTYLTERLPPPELVTSVRALVSSSDQILVVRDRTGLHILPGGQPEAGETLLEALQREVREETGWTIRDMRLLGIVHVYHLTPKPTQHPY